MRRRPGIALVLTGLMLLAVLMGIAAPASATPGDDGRPRTSGATSTPLVGASSASPTEPSTTAEPTATSSTDPSPTEASPSVDPSALPTGSGAASRQPEATPAPSSPAPPSQPRTAPTPKRTPSAARAGGALAVAQAPGSPALTKTANTSEVSPGETFSYTFVASCSGLEQSCVNAVLTDEIPADLDIRTLPEDTGEYDVQLVGHTLTIRFTIPLLSPPKPPGSVGLPDGSSINLTLGVGLAAESQVLDGTIISNTATLTSDGAGPVNARSDVVVDVPVVVTPVGTKTWTDGAAVAGTMEPSTITLGVRNGSSSSASVTDLRVEDATPAVFERFDVTGLGAVTFPAGANQVVVLACTQPSSACADSDYTASAPQTSAPLTLPVPAASVTGLRFVFSDAAGTPLPYDPSGGTVAVDLRLRDTVRSTGTPYNPTTNDVVQNCNLPSATESTLGLRAGTQACVSYTVYPAQATVGASKAFFSDTNGNLAPDGRAVIGQGSPVSAVTTATNTSPFPLSTLTVREPSATSPSELSKIDATSVRAVFPTGATTADVAIDCGAGPVTTTITATGDVALPSGCTIPTSVVVTFTGTDGAGNGTIAEGATARLGVRGTLSDRVDQSDVTAGPGASGDGVGNCADVTATSSIDGVGAAASTACGTLAVWQAYVDLRGVKTTFTGDWIPGFPRSFDLQFTNNGTIPATNVVLADPVDPTATPNFFQRADLATLTLPATPPATAEVWDPNVGGYVPFDAGDGALLTRSLGFRVNVAQLPPGATYALNFQAVQQADIPSGTVFQNCAGVSADGQGVTSFCGPSVTSAAPSSGAAVQKSITPTESVRPEAGLPATTVQVKLAMQNTGTSFLSRLVGVDNDPAFFDAVDVTGTVRVNFPPGADQVRVDACTSGMCGEGDWVLGTVTGSATPGLPAGVDPATVTGIRVTFSAIPVDRPGLPADPYRITSGTNFPTSGPCTQASVCIDVRPRAELRSAAGTPTPDTLLDTATGGYESRLQPVGTLAPVPPTSATHILTSGTAQLQFSKSPDRTAAPGVGIPFVLRVQNTGTGPIPDPTIVDPIPAGLEFSPLDPSAPYQINYTLPSGAPNPPQVVFSTVNDPTSGRTTAVRLDFPGWRLLPGAVVRVELRTVLAPGVVAGQNIENRAGASGARPDLGCDAKDVFRPGQAVDDPAFGPGRYCTSAAVVTAGEGNAFRTQKQPRPRLPQHIDRPASAPRRP